VRFGEVAKMMTVVDGGSEEVNGAEGGDEGKR